MAGAESDIVRAPRARQPIGSPQPADDSLRSAARGGLLRGQRRFSSGGHGTMTGAGNNRQQEREEMLRGIEAQARETVAWTGRSHFAPAVMQAMRDVPRHEFVPPSEEAVAYIDGPLPIGYGQTISQPYMVALMTDLAELQGAESVLEIGTGSGYQTAVLARLARAVYTIERVPALERAARQRLKQLGYDNVYVRFGDGYEGWREQAPFDVILVTAAAGEIPPPLIAQLRAGGRMIIPVGSGSYRQDLLLITKDQAGRLSKRSILPVAFVPLRRAVERGKS